MQNMIFFFLNVLRESFYKTIFTEGKKKHLYCFPPLSTSPSYLKIKKIKKKDFTLWPNVACKLNENILILRKQNGGQVKLIDKIS